MSRFDAHLALGGGLDPTWLDLFSEAVRVVTGGDGPADFIDARRELDGSGEEVDRVVERVDPAWIGTIARLPDHDVDAVAGRWIDLVEEELGFLPREEKPWIRQLAGDLVAFARAADRNGMNRWVRLLLHPNLACRRTAKLQRLAVYAQCQRLVIIARNHAQLRQQR
jgi:hypothetical protein